MAAFVRLWERGCWERKWKRVYCYYYKGGVGVSNSCLPGCKRTADWKTEVSFTLNIPRKEQWEKMTIYIPKAIFVDYTHGFRSHCSWDAEVAIKDFGSEVGEYSIVRDRSRGIYNPQSCSCLYSQRHSGQWATPVRSALVKNCGDVLKSLARKR